MTADVRSSRGTEACATAPRPRLYDPRPPSLRSEVYMSTAIPAMPLVAPFAAMKDFCDYFVEARASITAISKALGGFGAFFSPNGLTKGKE